MQDVNLLIYIVRRDLRVADNPILDRLASSTDHGFTHLLPVHIIPPYQIEVSGFLEDGEKSPFSEARSKIAGFWRCGPHRARFMAQSLWNMKENLNKLGNDLTVRIGSPAEVVKGLVEGLRENKKPVGAVWMIGEEGFEEERDEKEVAKVCSVLGIDHQVWVDEKYFIDDRDLRLESPEDLPDVFTTYRKMNEPLRECPRQIKPRPLEGSLPKPIEISQLPRQPWPFAIPSSLEAFDEALMRPLESSLPKIPAVEEDNNAHPFRGGEDEALGRLEYLIKSGIASLYKSSRNGLMGIDYSTKLSGYLAQGSITARQIHEELLHFENGTQPKYAETEGYGKGENEGTKAIRFELLWRDYMRLCTRKFRAKLFHLSGFRNDHAHQWQSGSADDEDMGNQPQPLGMISTLVKRVLEGTTGQSLIDASSRELIHTGYTSNRARQNVGSFLAKHLSIDWRYGAEWYEFLLVDYDVNSNWSNWQYVAGVGNDPRGEARIFNPVKQAFDYDKDGAYVRCWLPELRKIEKLENLFQPWTTPREDWERFGLVGLPMVQDPVKKINFSVEGKPKASRRPFARKRGRGRGDLGGSNRLTSSMPPSAAREEDGEQPRGPRRQFITRDTATSRGSPRGAPRGRGYGGPRRGFQGGRGGWQQPYGAGHGVIPMHTWPQMGPA